MDLGWATGKKNKKLDPLQLSKGSGGSDAVASDYGDSDNYSSSFTFSWEQTDSHLNQSFFPKTKEAVTSYTRTAFNEHRHPGRARNSPERTESMFQTRGTKEWRALNLVLGICFCFQTGWFNYSNSGFFGCSVPVLWCQSVNLLARWLS